MTTVSLGIPTYNRTKHVVRLLRSLHRQTLQPDEVIVVDQTKYTDESIMMELKRVCSEVGAQLILQKEPNLPKARNTILYHAQSEVVIFIDDDVVLTDTFIEEHISNYNNNNVGAVAGRIINRKYILKKMLNHKYGDVHDYLRFNHGYDRRVEGIAAFPGGNHSLRRLLAIEVGGYDENIAGLSYREETDMAIRLFVKGVLIIHDPLAGLYHINELSGGCKKNIFDEEVIRCLLYFTHKYRKRINIVALIREYWDIVRLTVVSKKIIKNPFVIAKNICAIIKNIIKV